LVRVPEAPIVLVSNRGPVSFAVGPDGGLDARRGSGGLASGLGSLGERGDCHWVAGALTDGDRIAAARGSVDAAGFHLRLVDPGADAWRRYYDEISNETLWFLHHGLFDPVREPAFDDEWRAAWEAYRGVNALFADHVSEVAAEGATVLVQDYHLSLLGGRLRRLRPDLRTVHFHHTPFCGPDELAVLPDDVAAALMEGLAGFDACGFHTRRWAARYEACVADVGLAPRRTFVAPLSVDADELRAATTDAATEAAVTRLDGIVEDRLLLARVDRIELSKNLLRGFQAFDLLLAREPRWRERVTFGAFCYPSREGVEAYRRYRVDLEELVARINERWARPGWTPIVLETDDDYPRSLAALRRNDVLLVNPVRDGLNLVAMEGAVVNERDGGLVLSRQAGCWDLLADTADGVHPFDLSDTASALARALGRDPAERAAMASRRREVVAARTAHDWLDDQLAAISR